MATAWAFLIVALAPRVAGLTDLSLFVILLSVPLTWWAGTLVAREWRGRTGVVRAVPVSALATMWIAWVAVLLRGLYDGASTTGRWGDVAAGFSLAMPFALGLFASALTRKRWPANGRWVALLGAVLAVCLGFLLSHDGASATSGVAAPLVAYFLWLVGAGTWSAVSAAAAAIRGD